MKLPIQRVMLGVCKHEIISTLIKGRGYGVRVFTNGVLNQEEVVQSKSEIGNAAKSMMRIEDKCGNISDYADRARSRIKS